MVTVSSIKSLFKQKINSIESINITEFNGLISEIEGKINYIVNYINRFKNEENKMNELKLDKVSGYNDIIDVINKNISLINQFLIDLSNDVYDNKIDSVANMGTITDIAFLNDEVKGSIDITSKDVVVYINNKQPIIINKDNVTHSNQSITLSDEE
jgi:hypothetical protein